MSADRLKRLWVNLISLKYLFKPRGLPCMFIEKRICSPETCQGYSKRPLRYCIYTDNGEEVFGPCKQLAAMGAAAHHTAVFEKRIIREIIKMDLGEVVRKEVVRTIKETFSNLS